MERAKRGTGEGGDSGVVTFFLLCHLLMVDVFTVEGEYGDGSERIL